MNKGTERRKGLTQKEMADRFNLSLTTVKKYTAESREKYEEEARKRRLQAYCYRNMGLKWDEVGERLGTTKHGAIALYKRYEKIDAPNNKEA